MWLIIAIRRSYKFKSQCWSGFGLSGGSDRIYHGVKIHWNLKTKLKKQIHLIQKVKMYNFISKNQEKKGRIKSSRFSFRSKFFSSEEPDSDPFNIRPDSKQFSFKTEKKNVMTQRKSFQGLFSSLSIKSGNKHQGNN